MTVATDIIAALRQSERALDDAELGEVLGLDPAKVNQECRRLAFAGRLIREQDRRGVITNRLDTGAPL